MPACDGNIIPGLISSLLVILIFSSRYITAWSAASWILLLIQISKKIFNNFLKVLSFSQSCEISTIVLFFITKRSLNFSISPTNKFLFLIIFFEKKSLLLTLCKTSRYGWFIFFSDLKTDTLFFESILIGFISSILYLTD